MKANPMAPLPQTIVLRFATHEDALTFSRTCEAYALDGSSGIDFASGALKDMAAWLKTNGYRWRPGSNGIWERPQ